MTDTAKLRSKIALEGLKYGYIANSLGLSRSGFQKKLENISDFRSREIQKLCILLRISDLEEKERIFFAENKN